MINKSLKKRFSFSAPIAFCTFLLIVSAQKANAQSIIRHKDEGEIFVTEKQNNVQIITNTDGKNLFRLFYDDLHRIVKKETWKIASIENSELTETETRLYEDGNLNPVQTTVSKKETEQIYFYNPDSSVKREENYQIITREIKDKNSISDSKTKTKDSETEENKTETLRVIQNFKEWTYTKDGKLESVFFKGFDYDKDSYEKPLKTYTKKDVYRYHEDEEVPADYYFYEDGKLRMKTEYQDKISSISTMYFDQNSSIKTYSQNGKKIKEEISQNGKIIRVKNYETENKDE